MISTLQTRVSARALKSAAVLAGAVGTGSAVGVALAAAYLAGGMAQAASQHARVTRLAAAAQEGFSETALLQAAEDMDPGVLAVARRHDPFTIAGDAQRDRQAALIAARLERQARAKVSNPLLLRASYGPGPAAAPFRLGGALDESRDLECLTQAIYYEARGEGPAGQAAVAQVVLNRVRHPAFPKSVCGVVFQGAYGRGTCQFSFACDGSMRRSREPGAWRRAHRVAEKALSGAVMSSVGNATHFHTLRVAPAWGSRLTRVAEVGMHVFYRFGGRAGRPSAFSVEPVLSTDAPEMAPEPIYAAPAPGVVLTSGSSGDQPLIRLTSMAGEDKIELASAAGAAMGGPAGPAPEPASAPAVARAAVALDGGPRTAAKPAAATDTPIRTAVPAAKAQPAKAQPAKAPAAKPVAEASPKAPAKPTSSSAS